MEEITVLSAFGLIALGLVASTYGVLIGSGGGFIVSPLLILVFNMDHNIAVGTSLIAVFLASFSGAISYFRRKRVDLRSALLFSMAAIPGVILGVLGVKEVAGPTFKVVFGLILTLLGVFIFSQPRPASERNMGRLLGQANETAPDPTPTKSRWQFGMTTRRIVVAEQRLYEYRFLEPAAVAMNTIFGFASGFFGIGGGPLRLPTLVYLFRFPVYIATATSVFTQAIYTSVGSAGHIINGNVFFPAALLVGAGVVAGAQIAVRLSGALRGQWVLRLLSLALVAIGVQLMLSAF